MDWVGYGWDGMGWDLCAGLFHEHRFAMLINKQPLPVKIPIKEKGRWSPHGRQVGTKWSGNGLIVVMMMMMTLRVVVCVNLLTLQTL